MTLGGPLSILESAAHLGRARYVELAAFATLGARALAVEDPAVSGFLAGAARAHGYRARLIEERLPISVGLPGVDEVTRSPGTRVDDALALCSAPGRDADVLSGVLDGLYPAMAVAYAERIAASWPVSDAAIVRCLRRAQFDLELVEAEGAVLERAAPDGRATTVKSLLVEAGGAFGPLR